MTTIIQLDPEALQEAATQLRNVVQRVGELTGNLGGVCCCEIPAGLGSYIDSELGSAGAMAVEAANGFGAAADDLVTRGELITNDQSLVGTLRTAYEVPESLPTVNDQPSTSISSATGDSGSSAGPGLITSIIGGGPGASILSDGGAPPAAGFTTSIIGGGPGASILGDGGAPPAAGFTTSIIGGDPAGLFGGAEGPPAGTGLTTSVIGGGDSPLGPYDLGPPPVWMTTLTDQLNPANSRPIPTAPSFPNAIVPPYFNPIRNPLPPTNSSPAP